LISNKPIADSNQDDLAGNAVRGDGPVEHILCGHIDVPLMSAEMHPQLASVVGRQLKAGRNGLHLFDPCLVGQDADCLRPKADAQHFQTQCWHNLPASHHDDGHAAHDAIALGIDAEEAATCRGFFQGWRVDQQMRKLEQPARWIERFPCHRCTRDAAQVALIDRCRNARLPEHDPRLADRGGEHIIITRQGVQLLTRRIVEVGE
jgi:hypothetical protein